jgi:uncharacterized protein YyaL (SSP411 family)
MCILPSPRLRLLTIFALLLPLVASLGAADAPAAKSAFLQANASSPIKWSAWGAEAFERAKHEDKPVYLAIGSFTSELSRAMARQSFSNPETAAYLNDNFVCILVDAKERPDVFALYQNFAQAVKQASGPPLNMWLTPEMKPFEGSNYLPPTEEWGKEGIVTTMKRVQTAWKSDPTAQRRKADEAIATVSEARAAGAPATVTDNEIAELLKASTETIRARFDSTHGGFGEPPKYIEPELLRFLLRDAATRGLAITTLRNVVNSSMRDPLDGGFFRYASDAEWRLPYFQKQLTDQARVSLALLEAAAVSNDAHLADAARGALNFALKLKTSSGDYVTVEDGAGDELAAQYLWTESEIHEVLGDKAGAEFAAAHGVKPEGNLADDAISGITTKGKNLLYRATPVGDPNAEKSLSESAAKLLAHRQQRGPLRRDEGAPAAAHGLLLSALSRAAQQLKDTTFLAAAKNEFTFVRDQLRAGSGSLIHLANQSTAAAPNDYVFVIDGLLAFSAAANQPDASKLAAAMLAELNSRYRDATTGRYYTTAADPGPQFWARVYSPAPTAGDLALPEPALLTAISSHPEFVAANPDLVSTLQRVIASDLKNAGEVPPADALLALRP